MDFEEFLNRFANADDFFAMRTLKVITQNRPRPSSAQLEKGTEKRNERKRLRRLRRVLDRCRVLKHMGRRITRQDSQTIGTSWRLPTPAIVPHLRATIHL